MLYLQYIHHNLQGITSAQLQPSQRRLKQTSVSRQNCLLNSRSRCTRDAEEERRGRMRCAGGGCTKGRDTHWQRGGEVAERLIALVRYTRLGHTNAGSNPALSVLASLPWGRRAPSGFGGK